MTFGLNREVGVFPCLAVSSRPLPSQALQSVLDTKSVTEDHRKFYIDEFHN
jgi:hypothetical protein